MTSNKPYLLRAIHEWLTDNNDVPHLIVTSGIPELTVIEDFAQDGRITLNISYDATEGLHISNSEITFSARFSGKPVTLNLPIMAVLGIYGRNTEEGIMFSDEDESEPAIAEEIAPEPEKKSSSPSHLKLLD